MGHSVKECEREGAREIVSEGESERVGNFCVKIDWFIFWAVKSNIFLTTLVGFFATFI